MTKITDRNKDLVSRVYEEMWNQGNFIVARQIIAQPAGVERFMQEFLSALPNLQHKVDVEEQTYKRSPTYFVQRQRSVVKSCPNALIRSSENDP